MEEALRNGADVNTKTWDNETPLSLAYFAEGGRVNQAAVQFLSNVPGIDLSARWNRPHYWTAPKQVMWL